MTKIIILLLFIVSQLVRGQLPIITPDGVHQRFITKTSDGSIVAKNDTGYILNILDCSSVVSYGDYCSISAVVNAKNIEIYNTNGQISFLSSEAARNFGNVMVRVSVFGMLISYGIGQLLYASLSSGGLSSYNSINTGGLSDPSSLADDYANNINYAAYSNINYNGAGVMVLRNLVSQQPKYEYITNFGYNSARTLNIAALVGYLMIGIPEANNGVGVVLIYDCFQEPCVYRGQVENPNPTRRFNFGSSVSVSFEGYDSFYLTVGIKNYKTDINGDILTNFNSGSAITYYCSISLSIMTCSLGSSYQYDLSTIQNPCYSENLNFGQSVQMASDTFFGLYTLISAPSSCNGAGAIWLYESQPGFLLSPTLVNIYNVSDYYEGDELGYNLYYDTRFNPITDNTFAYANSIEGGYIIPLPFITSPGLPRTTMERFLAKKPTSYRHRVIWTNMKKAAKIPRLRMNIN